MLDTQYVSWAGNPNGGGLFITSNGVNDAILWAYGKNAIYAFDASKDISAGPIWHVAASGTSSWGWPTITNGKIYLNGGNGDNVVYGL